jgi:transcriptional regulator with XRE-family HTH domain
MSAIDPMTARFARRIRAARTYRGLSQIEFARVVGAKTAATVSDWERGLRDPRRDTRVRLMQFITKAEAEQIEAEDGAAV